MSVQQLSADVSVCGQIRVEDLEAIVQMGFKTIVNNRPDGEALFGQPDHAKIAAKAQELGLQVYYLPLVAGHPPSEALLQEFNTIMETAPKPVLAYCRSGNRSGQIVMAAQALR